MEQDAQKVQDLRQQIQKMQQDKEQTDNISKKRKNMEKEEVLEDQRNVLNMGGECLCDSFLLDC